MISDMLRQRVQRLVDLRLVAQRRGLDFEPAQPDGALLLPGEQPMHVNAANESVARDGSVEPAVIEAQRGPRAIGSSGLAHVHFIAVERCAFGDALAPRLAQLFLRPEHCRDIEQSQPLCVAPPTFDAEGVGDASSQHLITSAHA